MSVRKGPRKSLISAPASTFVAQNAAETESIGINDDDRERRERIRERNRVLTADVGQTPLSAPRQSYGKAKLAKMTLAERNDHIEKCMQLNAENKINTKNAFSLLLIDQLIDQVKRQESNFQIASTQLDASAKIYACRVDKVHTEALRIAGGLIEADKKGSKKKLSVENEENSDAPDHSGDELDVTASKAKKTIKRRPKAVILKNEVLSSNNHLKNMLKSTDGYLQEMITSAEASEPGNSHFMSNLGISSSSELMMFSDILSAGPRCAEDLSSTMDLRDLPMPKSHLPSIPPWSDHPLCPPLKSLLSETADEGVTQMEPEDDGGAADFPAFDDGDAGIEDQDDIFFGEGGDNEDADDVEESMGREANAIIARSEPAAIVDFTRSITAQLLGPLQYSLLHKRSLNLMGGPEGWKIGNFITNRPSEANKKVVTKRKTKEPVTLEYLDSASGFEPFISSNKNVLSLKTITTSWQLKSNAISLEEVINLSQFERVSMRCRIQVLGMQTRVQDETRHKSNVESVLEMDNDGGGGDDDFGGSSDHMFMDDSDRAEPGFGLINSFSQDLPSNMSEPNAIPYARLAKKIDMKLLKVTVWRIIKLCDSNKENMTNGTTGAMRLSFQDLYRDLPAKLPTKMSDVLTPHLAFMALLHLANEENLLLMDTEDLSDVIISYS